MRHEYESRDGFDGDARYECECGALVDDNLPGMHVCVAFQTKTPAPMAFGEVAVAIVDFDKDGAVITCEECGDPALWVSGVPLCDCCMGGSIAESVAEAAMARRVSL